MSASRALKKIRLQKAREPAWQQGGEENLRVGPQLPWRHPPPDNLSNTPPWSKPSEWLMGAEEAKVTLIWDPVWGWFPPSPKASRFLTGIGVYRGRSVRK